jgi:cell fate regulator YaaT (PSP1 superfamily)
MFGEETKRDDISGKRRVIGVVFSLADKEQIFEIGDIEVSIHELVVVEGDKDDEIGIVATPPRECDASEVAANIKKVIRKANVEDIKKYNAAREDAMRFLKVCREKIAALGLPMKLIDASVSIGESKVVFYFTAEERVDFRALVKDLATTLHMRIEMRQIGARDASKGIGAIGVCGLICCCKSFIREFQSISIQMARDQGLAPNPAKLTGMCGKLKCCLYYENNLYLENSALLPPIGSAVRTFKGDGTVSNLDIPRMLVTVKLEESGHEETFRADEVRRLKE